LWWTAWATLAAAAMPAAAGEAPGRPARVVSVGGAVTEIVYALGAGDRVVAIDSTSRYPEAARRLPDVGYMRSLSAEGIVALAPTLVLAVAEAGPPRALDQLGLAGVPVRMFDETRTSEAVVARIRGVAAALDVAPEGARVAEAVAADFAAVEGSLRLVAGRPRVMFVMSVGHGSPLVAGADTAADSMIRLAAAENALAGFRGYKPVSAEAAVAAAPDYIVVMRETLQQIGGADALAAIPQLAPTRAARARRIVAFDGVYLLGFGPRSAHAVRDLAAALHPDAAIPLLPQRPWTR
jgi:iron complex transport system substrate-binding protein